jgi:hypothetical protein
MFKTVAPLCRRRLSSNSGTRALLRTAGGKSMQEPCPKRRDTPEGHLMPGRAVEGVSPTSFASRKQCLTVSPGRTTVEKRVDQETVDQRGVAQKLPAWPKVCQGFVDWGRDFGSVLARFGPPSMRKPLSRPEQDEHGTSQPSIRHQPPRRRAMRGYAVAPIHTSGVALRQGGPRDATCVPLPILTGNFSNPSLLDESWRTQAGATWPGPNSLPKPFRASASPT